ncbi:hypothetical protein AwPolaro_07760 [Polaromonas sp.]|nr:hypothetical protein AwPolaro_07760 [Polaromonas sp.]
MKKKLAALALLSATGLASAQSSVTLFGIVDAGLQYLTASGADSLTRMHSAGYKGSRIGFRGVEDLGSSMKAGFWLEAGFASDTGAGYATNTNNQVDGASGGGGLTFNRRATISLMAPWGELRAGRDYGAAYLTHSGFDAFGGVGIAAASNLTLGLADRIISPKGVTHVRVSNSLAYLLPDTLGGLYGKVMIAFGENSSGVKDKNDGNYYGARLGYKSGPFNVVAAYSETKTLQFQNYKDINMGASYDFSSFKLTGLIGTERVGVYTNDAIGFNSDGEVKHNSLNIGAVIPVGAGAIRTSYTMAKAKSPGHDKLAQGQMLALGYIHHLSKRTTLFSTYAHTKNDSGAFTHRYNNGLVSSERGGNTSGFEMGISHTF